MYNETHASLLHKSALYLLEQGFSVIPVNIDADKKPFIEWQKYQTQRATREEIDKWWKTWPSASPAIITGKISGIFVVDAEKEADLTLFGLDKIETPTVKTGRGGHHFYFKHEEKLGNTVRFAPFFDTRGNGGYVIAPPTTRKDGGKYEWLLPWGDVEPITLPDNIRTKLTEKPTSDLTTLLKTITPSGSRNNSATSVTGALLSRFRPDQWETQVWPLLRSWNISLCKPSLEEEELRAIYESICKAEINKKTLDKKGIAIFDATLLEPVLSKEKDTIKVKLSVEEGEVVFCFDEIEQTKSKEINVELTVYFQIPSLVSKSFVSRLNILSLSGTESFARQLANSLGKGFQWNLLLSTAITELRNYIRNKDDSFWLYEKQADSNRIEYLIEPFLLKNSPNLIFGMGGSHKTFFSLAMAVAYTSGRDFLGFKPQDTLPVLFIDYEDEPFNLQNRIKKIAKGNCFKMNEADASRLAIRYFNPEGKPLHDCLPSLKKIISEYEIGLVIVDSAALACGGDPSQAEISLRYFNALKSLNTTSLTIAHENKMGNSEYAFGSIFFHNAPRNIWNVRKNNEEDSKISHLGLFHKKSNNDCLKSPVSLKMFFGDDFIDFNFESVFDNFSDKASVPKRILHSLREIPKTYTILKQELVDISNNTLSATLNRLRIQGKIIREENDLWRIKEQMPIINDLNELTKF